MFETGRLAGPRLVINFRTKRHWRDKSRIGDIDSGLGALVGEVQCIPKHITFITITPLWNCLGGSVGEREVAGGRAEEECFPM